MKKPPNFNSWITLQPFVKRATLLEMSQMLIAESNSLKRPYILKRLISAYLSLLRKQLYKAHKITTKKAKP
jgi:hypothetical protein